MSDDPHQEITSLKIQLNNQTRISQEQGEKIDRLEDLTQRQDADIQKFQEENLQLLAGLGDKTDNVVCPFFCLAITY